MWSESFTRVAAQFDGAEYGCYHQIAGWSSLVARWAHNPKVGGSNPPPATNAIIQLRGIWILDCGLKWSNKTLNDIEIPPDEAGFSMSSEGRQQPLHTTDVFALRFACMKTPP